MGSLNDQVGRLLVSRLIVMRESYLGTLQRCLENLEKDCIDSEESPDLVDALKQVRKSKGIHVALELMIFHCR